MFKTASTVEKVCRVLDAFRCQPTMGVREVGHKTGLLPSDVHRLLHSLEQFGYVEQDTKTKKYRLGLELLRLGHLVHTRVELRDVARQFMMSLAERSEATANLAIVDPREHEVIFLEQVDYPGAASSTFRVGARVIDPHATSVGKVLLAFLRDSDLEAVLRKHGLTQRTPKTITNPTALQRELERVRQQGYATDREEALEGAFCVGSPIRDHRGEVVAAVSISLRIERVEEFGEPALVSLIRTSASKISAALGYQVRPPARKAANA